MTQKFQTRFKLTLDDFSALNTAYCRLTWPRRIGRYLNAFVIALMIAGIGFSLWVANDVAIAVYFAFIAAFLLLLEFVATSWRQRRSFEHQRLGEFEVEMAADAEGFTSRSEMADGRMKWAAIRHVDDLANHVILWPNNRIGWIVPKRAFATPAEADAFAQFAKEKTAGQKL